MRAGSLLLLLLLPNDKRGAARSSSSSSAAAGGSLVVSCSKEYTLSLVFFFFQVRDGGDVNNDVVSGSIQLYRRPTAIQRSGKNATVRSLSSRSLVSSSRSASGGRFKNGNLRTSFHRLMGSSFRCTAPMTGEDLSTLIVLLFRPGRRATPMSKREKQDKGGRTTMVL